MALLLLNLLVAKIKPKNHVYQDYNLVDSLKLLENIRSKDLIQYIEYAIGLAMKKYKMYKSNTKLCDLYKGL